MHLRSSPLLIVLERLRFEVPWVTEWVRGRPTTVEESVVWPGVAVAASEQLVAHLTFRWPPRVCIGQRVVGVRDVSPSTDVECLRRDGPGSRARVDHRLVDRELPMCLVAPRPDVLRRSTVVDRRSSEPLEPWTMEIQEVEAVPFLCVRPRRRCVVLVVRT